MILQILGGLFIVELVCIGAVMLYVKYGNYRQY